MCTFFYEVSLWARQDIGGREGDKTAERQQMMNSIYMIRFEAYTNTYKQATFTRCSRRLPDFKSPVEYSIALHAFVR